MSEPGLSMEQLLAALQRKGIPLPFEMGAFLVLEATEQVLALEATEDVPAFCLVSPAEVWLSDQGELSVEATRTAPEVEACQALVVLLGDLLVRSAPGVPPMLLELVEQGPTDGSFSLMRLRDDLEASLVPLNRAATRRVLARLLREVRRESERVPAAPAPDARVIDRELDALLGVDEQQRAQPKRPRAQAREDATAEVDLDELSPHEAAPSPPPETGAREPSAKATSQRPRKSRPAAKAGRAPEPERPAPRARKAPAELDAFEESAEPSGGGAGLRIGLGLVVLALALGAGYLLLGQKGSRSALGLAPQPETPPPPAIEKPRKPAPVVGELRINSTPARAQVLLKVGKGPVLVPKLPVGVAQEFVAVAEGFAPSRAVIPPDAAWQEEGGEARYELALQLGDANPRRGGDELGPTRLPQEVGRPKGALGSVRVITSPPGADVYLVIGFTPDVVVENQRVDEALELLVYLSGYELRRFPVAASDYKTVEGKLVADFDLKLNRKR